MELQNNYIPVRHLPNRSLTYEEKEITKEIIDTAQKMIKHEQKTQEIRKKIISNNEKMLSLKPILERGLEWLKTRQAEYSKEPNVASKTNIAKEAYATASKISQAITQINNFETTSITPIDKQQVLMQADFILNLGDYSRALNHYNTVLKDRENQPLANDYRPIEEKLRQASKLYMEFKPIIERLDIPNALKKNLFCTGISAHTQGAFTLSKAEVLHMLNNQFFYPV